MQIRLGAFATIALSTIVLLDASHARAVTVPKGTIMLVRTRDAIDSNRTGAGGKFMVSLEGALSVDGATVVPEGTYAYGVITNAKRDANIVGKSELTITLQQIKVDGRLIPIRTSGVKAVGAGKGRQTARKAATGAAIGAVFGGGRGAARGAAVGASAQLLLGGQQVSIPSNTLLEFTLADPIELSGREAGPVGPAANETRGEPSTGEASSVDSTSLAMDVARAQSENAAALSSYSWKQRTQLSHEGRALLVRLELLRVDLDGSLQRTTLSEDPNEAGDKAVYLERIQGLRSYGLPTAGMLLDFLQKASIDHDGDPIVAKATNVVAPGDEVELRVRAADRQLARVEASGDLDGERFEASIEYRTSKDGLNHPARANVRFPTRSIEIRIENFDYTKQ